MEPFRSRTTAMKSEDNTDNERSEFFDALRKGMLLGAAILVLVLPPMYMKRKAQQPPAQPPVATAPQQQPQQPPVAHAPATPAPEAPATRLADFKGETGSAEAIMVANWAAYTRDHKKHAFVVIDKKNAHMYVFDTHAKLISSAPVLLGKAVGDHTVPGIGDKPLSLVKEDEKTTPAGRFVAEPGRNTNGEDIIWVDYDAAVSMHRIRKVAEKERRYERLASPTKADNRISFGCINVPIAFYNDVLDPTVKKHGAIVYVLPDVKSVQQVFGAYDVLQARAPAQNSRIS
jgi:hypothetical protein